MRQSICLNADLSTDDLPLEIAIEDDELTLRQGEDRTYLTLPQFDAIAERIDAYRRAMSAAQGDTTVLPRLVLSTREAA